MYVSTGEQAAPGQARFAGGGGWRFDDRLRDNCMRLHTSTCSAFRSGRCSRHSRNQPTKASFQLYQPGLWYWKAATVASPARAATGACSEAVASPACCAALPPLMRPISGHIPHPCLSLRLLTGQVEPSDARRALAAASHCGGECAALPGEHRQPCHDDCQV